MCSNFYCCYLELNSESLLERFSWFRRTFKNSSTRLLTADVEAIRLMNFTFQLHPRDVPKFDLSITVEEACETLLEGTTNYREWIRANWVTQGLRNKMLVNPNLDQSVSKAKWYDTDLGKQTRGISVVIKKCDHLTKLSETFLYGLYGENDINRFKAHRNCLKCSVQCSMYF